MPLLLAFADSHVTELEESVTGSATAGLERPLRLAYGLVRPGLDHPPPGRGEGLRDNVMGKLGVPGMVSRVWPPRRGDVSLSLEVPWRCRLEGTLLDTEDLLRR